MPDSALFPEVDQILSLLAKDDEQDIVVVVIPSHDKHGKELTDQDQWAASAMKLVATLYRGGTAFLAHSGIYKDDEGRLHHDRPILVESYAKCSDIEDPSRLSKLVDFARRMGRETRQKSVMLVFGLVSFYIEDFSAAVRA